MVLCPGTNCPKKMTCAHFAEDIDKLTEDHFAWAPVKTNGTCSYYFGISEQALLTHTKLLTDARR